MAGRDAASSVVDRDGPREAVVAFLGGVAFGADALGLASLFEEAPALGQRGLGIGPTVAGARQGVPVTLELGERDLALIEGGLGLLDDLLGDLEPAGVAVAPGGQVVERLVELLAGAARAPVGAADRCLETVAQRALVAGQVAQLEVVDRGGRAEEALGREAGELGHDLVGEGRVGDRLAVPGELDRAARAGEGLLEGAGRCCRPPRPARSR